MTVFLTSDLHFGHANILTYCPERGATFADVPAMNIGLIDRWNAAVTPRDTVYVLGDVAMGHRDETLRYVTLLNGTKHLIAGNHDNCWEHAKNPAKWRDRYFDAGFVTIETEGFLDTPAGAVRLHHFPYSGDHTEEDRYSQERPVDDGTPLFHGHVHDQWQFKRSALGTPQVNVGVDVWDFRPVSLSEVVASFLHP